MSESELMQEYVELNAKIREMENRKDEIKTKMLIFAKTKQITDYRDNGFHFYITTQRRRSQDKEALNTYLIENSSGKVSLENFETINEIEMVRIEADK